MSAYARALRRLVNEAQGRMLQTSRLIALAGRLDLGDEGGREAGSEILGIVEGLLESAGRDSEALRDLADYMEEANRLMRGETGKPGEETGA